MFLAVGKLLDFLDGPSNSLMLEFDSCGVVRSQDTRARTSAKTAVLGAKPASDELQIPPLYIDTLWCGCNVDAMQMHVLSCGYTEKHLPRAGHTALRSRSAIKAAIDSFLLRIV